MTQQAKEAAQTAVESGQQVAGTAVQEGKNVAVEAGQQIRRLAGQARGQLDEQASAQQQRATEGLRSLGDELQSMVELGGKGGLGSQLGEQASQRARELADWLGQRQPGDLLAEVNNYARRRPGTFFLGALVAGIIVGRLTRGMLSAARENGSQDSDSHPMGETTPPTGHLGETIPPTGYLGETDGTAPLTSSPAISSSTIGEVRQ